MNKLTRYIFIVLLFLLLIAIRAIAISYFYDPLIHYFKSDHLNLPFPEIHFGKYFLFLLIKYSLNTIVSLTIIYTLFLSLKTVTFAIKFYVIAFVILSVVLFVFLNFNLTDSYLPTFYIRRFLIHPLFLLVLVPAFYYQLIKYKNESF